MRGRRGAILHPIQQMTHAYLTVESTYYVLPAHPLWCVGHGSLPNETHIKVFFPWEVNISFISLGDQSDEGQLTFEPSEFHCLHKKGDLQLSWSMMAIYKAPNEPWQALTFERPPLHLEGMVKVSKSPLAPRLREMKRSTLCVLCS